MSFSNKAGRIRNRLGRFTKTSVLIEVMRHLHTPEATNHDRIKKMPWISCLLIEWLFQIDESTHAREASAKDVIKVMNDIYSLQSEASSFRDGVKLELALRKLLISQLSWQHDNLVYKFTLTRLYSFFLSNNASSSFADDFKKLSGIKLTDFFLISLWLLLRFDDTRHSLTYSDLIVELYPHYTMQTITTSLKIIGGNRTQIGNLINQHKSKIIHPESYFSDPLLLKKPVIFFNDGIATLHNSLLSRSISVFVLETLKAGDIDRFRKKFSPVFENYVGIVLKESGINFITESEIKEIYKDNGLTGKVVDYLVQDTDYSIFIDAKGIEPHQKIKISDNPNILRDKLRSSFTKGIEQAFETAKLILRCNKPVLSNRENRYALVVTHQDFFISNGVKLKQQIASSFIQDIESSYGNTIPIENVYFMCIEDFEGVILLCKENKTLLSEFLSFCVKQDKNPATQKFDVRQHIHDYAKKIGAINAGPIGTNYILEYKDRLFDELFTTVMKNRIYWRERGIPGIPDFLLRVNELKQVLL